MSIFGSIASAIFGKSSAPGTTAATGSTTTTASTGPAVVPGATPGKAMTIDQVNGMIQNLAAGQHEDLDWKQSIVDLMKLLKLDSSLGARKQLAQELGYTGALNGSAEMNVWLHQQVMTKLAESGGVVTDSLKKSA